MKTRSIALYLAALCLSACGSSLSSEWRPISEMSADVSRYKDAPAVILDEEYRISMRSGRNDGYQEKQRHRVIKILSEAGLSYAELRIPVGDYEKITLLRARTISPDGKSEEVARSKMLVTESRGGREAGSSDANGSFRVFRFPNVHVGSVVEFIYTLELNQGFEPFHSDRIGDTLPSLHYRAEIFVDPDLHTAVKVYNLDKGFVRSPDGPFGGVVFRLEAGPIIADKDEDSRPPWRQDEPWWVYRNKGWSGATYHDWTGSWDKAMESRAKELYRSKELRQKNAALATLGDGELSYCHRDRECLVAKALEKTRALAELDEFTDVLVPRPLAKVLATGTANNHEKALLLQQILTSAGVEAEFAFSTRNAVGAIDKDFPLPTLFDHTLVYVAPGDGRGELFLDPSCEYCKSGEIPEWDRRAEALVVSPSDNGLGEFAAKARFLPITGTASRAAEVRRDFDVHLLASGDAEVSAEELRTGVFAMRERQRTRTTSDERRLDEARSTVTSRFAAARLGDTRSSCDRTDGECRQTLAYTLPGYGATDGDRLLVPLTLLTLPSSTRYGPGARRTPIDFPADRRYTETITLHLPDGYSAPKLPPATTLTTAALSIEISFEQRRTELVIRRSLLEKGGTYPTYEYGPARDAVQRFADVRHAMIVLVRDPAPAATAASPPALPAATLP